MYVLASPIPDLNQDLVFGLLAHPSLTPLITRIPPESLPRFLREQEAAGARWVFTRTRSLYLNWLKLGLQITRAHDLELVGNILANAASLEPSQRPRPLKEFSSSEESITQDALFTQDTESPEQHLADMAIILREQRQGIHAGGAKLALLCSAESSGALVATELEHIGVPFSQEDHEQTLTEALGAKPSGWEKPALLSAAGAEIVDELGVGHFNIDSPQELLRALHRAGLEVESTSKWELRRLEHPVATKLVEYKKLYRLYSTNGWVWLKNWVRGDRFRPEYVVSGVVTGRWASRGGGALQVPRFMRSSIKAQQGWVLVVGDADQLEPRILAAMSQDTALAEAGRGKDLYQGMADEVFAGDRARAKISMLGAIYGASTGIGSEVVPALRRKYPRAMAVVDQAAATGESGGRVSTFLGRCTPELEQSWHTLHSSDSAQDQRRARTMARTRGRFTRNFVVQGSAAEWALCWLGLIRAGLSNIAAEHPELAAPELVFFLHDEVIIHAPTELAGQCEGLITRSATEASTLMFRNDLVDFPISTAQVERLSQAKE